MGHLISIAPQHSTLAYATPAFPNRPITIAEFLGRAPCGSRDSGACDCPTRRVVMLCQIKNTALQFDVCASVRSDGAHMCPPVMIAPLTCSGSLVLWLVGLGSAGFEQTLVSCCEATWLDFLSATYQPSSLGPRFGPQRNDSTSCGWLGKGTRASTLFVPLRSTLEVPTNTFPCMFGAWRHV